MVFKCNLNSKLAEWPLRIFVLYGNVTRRVQHEPQSLPITFRFAPEPESSWSAYRNVQIDSSIETIAFCRFYNGH